MTSRKAAFTASLGLVAGSILWLFAGCSLPTSGLPPTDGGTPCASDDQCNDMNQCTADKCTGGFCENVAVPDAPAATQTPGDCKKIICSNGAESTVPDDADLQDDDNSCTTDVCTAGTPAHNKVTAGTACTLAGQMGVCNDSATCKISCGMPNTPPCNDNNPCTDDPCNFTTHQCDFTPIPDGTPTPGVAQTDHDCKFRQCIGGKDTDAPDDTDLPTAPNDCVTPTCAGGVGSLPNKATGIGCSSNGGTVCDGGGACVACNVDGDCMGPTDECQHPSCSGHTCGVSYTPVDTPLANQTSGDCLTVVCDGNGKTKLNNNDQDTKDDGNPCTDDVCNNGTLSHPNKASGVSCGAMLVCNGSGSCVGCNTDMDCQAGKKCDPPGCGMPNVCACCPKTCAQLGATCGNWSDGCGGMAGCNDGMKDGAETDVDCGGGSGCNQKCGQGKKCAANSDCQSNFCVEGVCCNSACNGTCQSCLAANKVSGSDGTCGNVKDGSDPNSQCPDQGQQSCGTDGKCDGAGACRYYAVGSVCQAASCAGVTTLNKADTCNAAHTCQDNMTQDCGNYVCANNACKTMCGSNMDCANNTLYCAAPNCVLKKANGGMCAGSGECTSGNCIDGYCCDMGCGGTCEACDVPSKEGTCSPVPLGTSDPSCGGNYVCDGNRSCLLKNGQGCGMDSDCASHNCTGGPKTCQP